MNYLNAEAICSQRVKALQNTLRTFSRWRAERAA